MSLAFTCVDGRVSCPTTGVVGSAGSDAIKGMLDAANATQPQGWAGLVGLVVLIFSAAGFIGALQDALDFGVGYTGAACAPGLRVRQSREGMRYTRQRRGPCATFVRSDKPRRPPNTTAIRRPYWAVQVIVVAWYVFFRISLFMVMSPHNLSPTLFPSAPKPSQQE